MLSKSNLLACSRQHRTDFQLCLQCELLASKHVGVLTLTDLRYTLFWIYTFLAIVYDVSITPRLVMYWHLDE